MAITEFRGHSSPIEAPASNRWPNGHSSNLAATRVASIAVRKANREVTDKTAAELKAKAVKDADDPAACGVEIIITLKTQPQEAQQLVNVTKAQSTEAMSMTEAL
ncbi:hypothetical protein CFIO01_03866 [Colletotrichum fioriniae PJ7]|uniref:Uncharacterized protein n=1 Tax=Colletotrichum fioriniae PJ7 TaxID=1445577 RepID=A0A010QNI4_9PEZI|nr:hypothetical protein CFIO01_03866 [Colletotrichum fioriniae PJ7]